MSRFCIRISIFASVLECGTLTHLAPVRVAERRPYAGQACARDEVRNDVRTLCVIDRPRAAPDSGQVYSLAVPDGGKRPEWAIDATIEANLLNDGEVKWFNVRTKDVNAYDTIEKSITRRFGNPVYVPKGTAISRDVEWYTPEVQVSLACVQKVGCYVHFLAHDNAKGSNRQSSGKTPFRPRPVSP